MSKHNEQDVYKSNMHPKSRIRNEMETMIARVEDYNMAPMT